MGHLRTLLRANMAFAAAITIFMLLRMDGLILSTSISFTERNLRGKLDHYFLSSPIEPAENIAKEAEPMKTRETSDTFLNNEPLIMAGVENSAELDKGMGACLFMMDDNHYLVEWLAYHYQVLPLRRLIVSIDPKSETSPMEILSRYNGLINITFLEQSDFVTARKVEHAMWKIEHAPNEKEKDTAKIWAHRLFQNSFLTTCLRQLRTEEYTWVTHIDTDERIVVDNQYNPEPLPVKRPTLLQTLNDPENRAARKNLREAGCIIMPRYNFGAKEELEPVKVYRDFPRQLEEPDKDLKDIESFTPIHPTDLMTYRWRYRKSFARKSMHGKSLVNVQNIPKGWERKTNAHRLVVGVCQGNLQPNGLNAPFVVNHYKGSWEEFSFRSGDRRGSYKRNKDKFDLWKQEETETDDDNARGWLSGFIENVGGVGKAALLLKGAGKLSPRENATSTTPGDT